MVAVVFLLPSISFADFQSNLKYGMTGTNVTQLQDLLSSEGCLSVPSTGYFGLLTLSGVKCFQTKYAIFPVSGYFGILSRTKANTIIADDTTASTQDELTETGSVAPIVPCSNGEKFNMQTGQLCDQSNTQAVTALTQQVQNLTNIIKSIPTTTPAVVQPTESSPTPLAHVVSLGERTCESISNFVIGIPLTVSTALSRPDQYTYNVSTEYSIVLDRTTIPSSPTWGTNYFAHITGTITLPDQTIRDFDEFGTHQLIINSGNGQNPVNPNQNKYQFPDGSILNYNINLTQGNSAIGGTQIASTSGTLTIQNCIPPYPINDQATSSATTT